MAAALGRVVMEGLAKPVLRGDCVAALFAASCICAADSQAYAELEREKVWAAALQPNSALLAPATLAKLPAEDAPLGAALAEVLLIQVRSLVGVPPSVCWRKEPLFQQDHGI